MTVKEYLESTFDPDNKYNVRKGVTCADGFTVSIQGGTFSHYCSPRELCNVYHMVELGFPSAEMPELSEYAEKPENHKDSIFGYVPIEKVESVIASHGGIVA